MQTAPLPDAEEARDNATFAALLAALSRPGSVHRMPEPGPLAIALALIDRECRVWANDPAMSDALRRTGATLVPSELAGHLFLTADSPAALERLSRVTCGDELYPDEGATVILPARLGEGPGLSLSGPGIDGTAGLRLGGLHPGLWAVRADLCRYPFGIEMILFDGTSVAAIPRSTQVEVI
jgi:alpha-D-ribose 1-methylphosphonate 5-triphosphate synthase subunit PhnH